ncbi:aspartate/glutamate racemase family protein [Dactylosporangium vinaceum]|uniref:Aspartate/glutamate racemase family protein n=1 Tax=Dactylosporangium vinaceum TaxID=53362 RepID=A0ABV5LZG2_9ACTN|nr:aspartate/glutamate racemase family protein [Dactylosporangium vinaceum]UAB92810.1 aspartate/glutamate racemase family protein [Dactylosporangium vinaceum]
MPAHPLVSGGAPATVGVLGGMGPLASAAFVQTMYEMAIERTGPATEQALPRCLLDSDPSIPDRTEAILTGGAEELSRLIAERVDALIRLGADRVVLACVTAHHLLGEVEPGQRARLVSLIDAVFDELAVAAPGRFLLLATTGTRQARTFERSPRWPAVAHRVVLPPPDVQDEIHYLLYRLKREPVTPAIVARVEGLARQFDCEGVIGGCTELHLITRWRRVNRRGPVILDPLLGVAATLTKLSDA